jgi:hypothetical protein
MRGLAELFGASSVSFDATRREVRVRTIHRAVVDVAGDPWVDLEKEVVAAFARD